ncbi:DUF1674 domain-containing protein [Mesorhizobium sp.]|uniref:DUF1674 domain-containing protein n=1 Tax=Mesorhizobium sp. TaxID=1871066 RepID=UPI000FE30DB9|nr:DUF1674 domain-containing protein [Mesorhizobium sp.]RWN59055.1 MAG: DUF1674 domain-containing protein [Mesorhizobium sp.]RWN63822.1 MAG: DUF1674 domain-containing protein [Mesorhizobium sp.]RWN80562.1 MAG: DUF1674 domain-containing protein [Mesorhizobium sp.]RWN83653.1 MAG: DUF1674 domain-containing protein [Mesorhizobium sp.]RWN87598.1 MAG: DUF1674 domain-containing protein [Mesorhizobium sp.]
MIDKANISGETSNADAGPGHDVPQRTLTPAARRALAEAEARREHYRQQEAAMPRELGGRGGREPGRYGDWEVKGLTSDF